MAFDVSYVFTARDKFTAVANRVKKATKRVRAQMRLLRRQVKSTGDVLGNFGKAFFAIAGLMATLAIFALPIRQAIEFESALSDLNKVMDFALPDGLQRTAEGIQELSRSIPVATTGLVDIAAAGAQFGVIEKDILSFTESVSKISVAFDIAPKDAGNAVAKLSNIFQISVTDFEDFADSINLVSNNTASAAEEIVRALQNKGAAAGQAMGLAKEDTLALASTFIQLGTNANRVGSIMDSMSRRLADASIVGTKFAKEFADKPKESLIKLFQKINKLKGEKRVAFLTEKFGEFGGRVGLVAKTMNKNLIPTMELANDKVRAAGSVNEEFQIRSATTEAKLKILANKFTIVGQRIGAKFLPTVNAGAEALSFMADALAMVIDVTGPIIPMILTFVTVVGLVVLATKAWAFAQARLNIQLFLNPVGLIIAGIAALIVGIIFLIKKVNEMGGFINVFKRIGNAIIDFLVFKFRLVAQAIDAITGLDLTSKLDELVEGFKFELDPAEAARSAAEAASAAVNAAKEKFKDAREDLSTAISGAQSQEVIDRLASIAAKAQNAQEKAIKESDKLSEKFQKIKEDEATKLAESSEKIKQQTEAALVRAGGKPTTEAIAGASATQKVQSDINLTLNAPPGTVKSIETKTTGNGRTNVGQNAALAGA